MAYELHAFSTGLLHVFEKFVGSTLLTTENVVSVPKKLSGITARIDLQGLIKGKTFLNIDEAGIRNVHAKLARHDDSDQRLMDTAGELLNMLVGYAQRHSNVKYAFSVPVTLKGQDHALSLSNSNVEGVKFVFDDCIILFVLSS